MFAGLGRDSGTQKEILKQTWLGSFLPTQVLCTIVENRPHYLNQSMDLETRGAAGSGGFVMVLLGSHLVGRHSHGSYNKHFIF